MSKSQPETQAEDKTFSQSYRKIFLLVYVGGVGGDSQGHAPSVMMILSRAVSQEEVNPLCASNTIYRHREKVFTTGTAS